MSKVCGCGKGYKSAHDGKCGHCRTKKEQKARQDSFKPKQIREFKDEYRFLSNFYRVRVMFEGVIYPSSEHAYMAAKSDDPAVRAQIAQCNTPAEAKKLGRAIKLRSGWEQMKEAVMLQILFDKFTRNPTLKQKLVATDGYELVEGNWWGDKIWGVCLKTNQGQNLLGKALMTVRSHLLRPPKMLYYAGIGSRQTPEHVLEQMYRIGQQLADVWTVRSGFADGADKAFCLGAEEANGPMENFVPWQGFNEAPSSYDDERFIYHQIDSATVDQAWAIAKKFHPNWDACSQAAKAMHTRNVYQVLGRDLKTHSDMVVCWTPRGSGSGGTGQAIRIARGYGIPVFDLAIEEHKQKLCEFVDAMELKQLQDQIPW